MTLDHDDSTMNIVMAIIIIIIIMRSRINVTDERPSVRLSVCLSRLSTMHASAAGLLLRAIERCRRHAAGAVLQQPALSSKCGQRLVDHRRRRREHAPVCFGVELTTENCQ